MRDLTQEVLDKFQEHVESTGELPDLSTSASRAYATKKRKNFGDKIASILAGIKDRAVFPEEQELLESVRSGKHWLPDNQAFWGPYLFVWDARLAHYQSNHDTYRKKGIHICRTTHYYSYHACEVTEVYVADINGKVLHTAEGVYGEKSAWDSAYEWMRANGFTHYLHRGALPPNSGATPYAWMDIKPVREEVKNDVSHPTNTDAEMRGSGSRKVSSQLYCDTK